MIRKVFLTVAASLAFSIVGPSLPVLADNSSSSKIVFWSAPRQPELWWGTAGTVVGAQLYQWLGMERGPAIAYSILQTGAVELGEIYLKNETFHGHPLATDALGILMGTLINVNIHFGYARGNTSDKVPVEQVQ